MASDATRRTDPKQQKALDALHKFSVPSPDALLAARKALADKVKEMAVRHGFDAQSFGEKLASVEDPPREHIPYSSALVKAWMDGAVVPSMQAVDAMGALMDDETEEAQLHALHEAADFNWQRGKRDYYELLSQACLPGQNGRGLPQFVAEQADPPLNKGNVGHYLRQHAQVPDEVIACVSQALQTAGVEREKAEAIASRYHAFNALGKEKALKVSHNEMSYWCVQAKHALKMNLDELSEVLEEHDVYTQQGDAISVPYLCNMLANRTMFDHQFVHTLDVLLQQAGHAEMAHGSALFDQCLKQHAEHEWQAAMEKNDLGMALKACRSRMGLTGPALFELLDTGRKSPVSLHNWEDGCKHIPDAQVVARYIALMHAWEKSETTAAGTAHAMGAEPWFDSEKAATLTRMLREVVARKDGARVAPSDTEVPQTTIDAETARYEGVVFDRQQSRLPMHAA